MTLCENLRCSIWTTRLKKDVGIPRVLVVDDFTDTADAISTVLTLDEMETQVAYDGNTAIRTTEQWRPDAVLLDIWMPDISGLEVAARLRANSATSSIILIAHSAAAAPADLERAHAAGFDAFCAKPLDARMFKPLIRHFCQAGSADRR
ncbi:MULTISPECIES: response regulator [unclassified Caballeronia]|uniref:response regulator n=1 Tax=unclassified Caballeronia TaxID=2646786 RepID=UPI0020281639|nr:MULTISPECIES: response regulator [unclassified Caballeronia]